jgi:hypothetical protein
MCEIKITSAQAAVPRRRSYRGGRIIYVLFFIRLTSPATNAPIDLTTNPITHTRSRYCACCFFHVVSFCKDRRARAIQRAKERNIIIPTYAQMKDPSKIPAKVKEELKGIGLWDIHPRNLFRINWHNQPTASGGTLAESITLSFPLR